MCGNFVICHQSYKIRIWPELRAWFWPSLAHFTKSQPSFLSLPSIFCIFNESQCHCSLNMKQQSEADRVSTAQRLVLSWEIHFSQRENVLNWSLKYPHHSCETSPLNLCVGLSQWGPRGPACLSLLFQRQCCDTGFSRQGRLMDDWFDPSWCSFHL